MEWLRAEINMLGTKSHMRVQRSGTIKVLILVGVLKEMSFGCNPMERHKIYDREEDGGLLSSLISVNLVSLKQVYDPKLVPFALSTCIV
jgi:hypothetical protein